MEADLSRYHGIDYRDRWRKDEHDRPRLTLRMIAVRVRHLPEDSAVRRVLNDGEPEWTRVEVLLTDLWSAWAGKEHPRIAQARKKGKKLQSARRLGVIAAARRRRRERKRRIEAGEIT